jgi:putative transposase
VSDHQPQPDATDSPTTIVVQRAWRCTLAPTPAQQQMLCQHAGAARWAFNLALSAKIVSRGVWEQRVQALVDEEGVPEDQARKQVKIKTPGSNVVDKARVRVRGTDRWGMPCTADWVDARRVLIDNKIDEEVADEILTRWASRVDDPSEGIAPWLTEVPNGLVQRGEKNADKAWQAWMDSVTGRRKGRRVGFPRFKKRGVRDSFYLTNTESGPCLGSNRHVRLGGKLGDVQVCDADGKRALRRLHRRLRQGTCRIMSVTVSRGGHRWYASVMTEETLPAPRPSRRAVEAGTIGVHLGVHDRAVLSTGEIIENPRIKARHARAIAKAQRALSRTGWDVDDDGRKRPTRRREKARQRVARLAHLEAQRRNTHTHHLSKRLATGYAEIVMLDLDIQGMTRTARRCRPPLHGWDAQAKRTANTAFLDVAPFELRRQVAYKTTWRGARLTVAPKGTAVVGICPECGAVRVKRPVRGDRITCPCGAVYGRGHAAALILARHGVVACNTRETENARGEDVRPTAPRDSRRSPSKREDPRHLRGSPPGSDAGAFPLRT